MIKISQILKTLIASSTFIIGTLSRTSGEEKIPTPKDEKTKIEQTKSETKKSEAKQPEAKQNEIKIEGAGILPYVIDRNQGKRPKIYFLLGRDNQGEIKNLWSDFGGRKEETDKSFEETAAREGSDELLGVLSKEELLEKIKTAKRIGNTFIINIESLIGQPAGQHEREQFVKKLKNSRKALLKDKKKYKEQLEKDKFAWWKGKELVRAVRSKSNKLRLFMIEFYSPEVDTLETIS